MAPVVSPYSTRPRQSDVAYCRVGRIGTTTIAGLERKPFDFITIIQSQYKQFRNRCATHMFYSRDRATRVSRAKIIYGIVWQGQQWLGNVQTTHGRCSLHEGLTSGVPSTSTHPGTNQARRCLTWSTGHCTIGRIHVLRREAMIPRTIPDKI